MMDCQQAFALLQDILDKEVSQIDEKEVRAHLNKCSHCFEKFRLEESIQGFLNEKIKSSLAVTEKSDKLETMRLDIMGQLDKIDAECKATNQSSFGSPFKIFLSTAALVVLVSMWYLSTGFFNHHDYYIPLEQAHWTTSDNLVAYTNVNDVNDYIVSIENDLKYNFNQSFEGYTLIGGKNENIMDADFEHIVYGNGDDQISIFVTSADNFEIPSDLQATMIKKGTREIFDHNCRGCRLIFHKIGSLMIITASTNKNIELLDFNPGHLTI